MGLGKWDHRIGWILALTLVLIIGNTSEAQQTTRIPGLGSFQLGNVKVSPNVYVGCQRTGVNFNLPQNWISAHNDRSLDLALKNVNLAMGGVALDVTIGQKLSVFFVAEGNALRNTNVITPQNYTYALGPWLPYKWEGSQFQWWSVDGGVAYVITPGAGLVAGLRADHISVGLKNPVNRAGQAVSYVGRYFNVSGDLLIKIWNPYLGVRFDGINYRAWFIGSPFSTCKVIIPTRWIDIVTATGDDDLLETKCSLSKPGGFLEFGMDYDVALSRNASILMWGKANWNRFSGLGNSNRVQNVTAGFGPGASNAEFASNTATLTRFVTSGGLGASLNF